MSSAFLIAQSALWENTSSTKHINLAYPAKKKRKEQRDYDKELYKARHMVENAFLYLKQWRGIATRYAKNTASFLAAIHIQPIF